MVKSIFCHNKDLITQTILEILVLGARDKGLSKYVFPSGITTRSSEIP